MDRDVLYDKKWFTFLRQAEMFRKIPFVDLVLASGSLVLGDVNKDSDFDVLVGVRQGRLYTARFFCLAIFKMLGWRNHIKKGRSGFCFNHFVTPAAYCLAPPYSDYDRRLYKNIKPVFGAPEKVAEFFKANAGWVNIGDVVSPQDLRHPIAKGDVAFGDLRLNLVKYL